MITQNTTDHNWYALYTNPRFEKKAHERLLLNDYESFLPLITTIRQWSDRKKKVQVPLIPGYIFVKIDKNKLINVLPIPGVINVLKHLGKPAVIQDYEIENLKILLEDSSKFNIIEESNLRKGDSIIVEKGIFKGLIAECIKLNGKHRVIVRIQGIENIIEVNISLSYVKKMN